MATKEEIIRIKGLLDAERIDYMENEQYTKGRNYGILKGPRKKAPDNRIPIPLAKMAVEDLTGYAARPGDIQIEYNKAEGAEDDKYNVIWEYWKDLNKDDIELSELYQKMLTHGKAFELWWTMESEEVTIDPHWKIIKGNKIYIKYTEELKPEKEYACYFREVDEREICDVYYPYFSERWIKTDDGWSRDEEGDTQYPYPQVPVIEYYGSMDKLPLFEAEKAIIDAIDTLISKSVNEIDRYNALITLFPGKINKELKDKLIEIGVLDSLDQYERWPEYLEKNLSGVNDFYENLGNRLIELFHKTIKIPDMTDENFAGNQSGIAIAYKLIGMEFKAAMIETYFNQGIKERKDLLDAVISANVGMFDPAEYKTVIDAKRNLPVDEATKVQIAVQLKGLVSDEALLKFLPNSIVPDIAAELERMEEQKEKNAEMFQQSMSDAEDDTED